METLDLVGIRTIPIFLEELTTFVSSEEAGAISTFSGTTRNNFEGKKVTRLEYEAYIPMATKEMQKICNEIRSRWKVIKIAMVHRIGIVPIGHSSVIIAISSDHRKESLDAVQFAIDEIKSKVPIWKREFYAKEDNTEEEGVWKENKECCFSKSSQLSQTHNLVKDDHHH